MSPSRPAAVIILAAGEGTRMKSTVPKVLHPLCGRSMLGHAIAAARELSPERLIVVVGHRGDEVAAHAVSEAPEAEVVVQDRQGGTGHAVRTVIEAVGLIPGQIIITYGDMPLLRAATLASLARAHDEAGNTVTVLTAEVAQPAGYGRIVRDGSGVISEIVEETEATDEQRLISEVNSGCYALDGSLLADAIKRIAASKVLGQEYLTDVVAILRGDGHRVGTVLADDSAEIQGVNDRVQLAQARRIYNDRLLEHWMRSGVTIVDPATTWLDVHVTLEADAEIGPSTQLEGRTTIASGARVGPGCVLRDTTGTLGVRVTSGERWSAARSSDSVWIDGQLIRVKVSVGRIKAEFEDVARAARRTGQSLREIAFRAEALWRTEHGRPGMARSNGSDGSIAISRATRSAPRPSSPSSSDPGDGEDDSA